MIGMSDKQILDYFTESFLANIESQLLDIEDMDMAIVKAVALALLLKLELPQATCSTILAHIPNTVDDGTQSCYENKQSESGLFHKMYCKTGINPKRNEKDSSRS